MALQDLLAALEREAEQRISAEQAEAAAAAAALTRDAEALRVARRDDALARERSRLETTAARDVALATREAEHAVLTAREALVERVLGLVREGLAREALSPAEVAALARLAERALDHAGDRPALVRTTSALRQAVADRCAARGVPVEVDAALHAGSQVGTADGRVLIDASLPGRLVAREAEARIHIVASLEPPA
ncbi:MAG: hypothetical protein IPO73_15995 [Gemmatimonadetes bacterium]|nr:hypothetical protein [Gemmatimonadota bacterium]